MPGGGFLIEMESSLKLIPTGLWFSPARVLERFYEICALRGIETVMHESKYQEPREAWITASFFLGLRDLHETDSWLAHGDNPPDVLSRQFVDAPKGRNALEQSIEVCEWEKNSPQASLETAISSKLSGKGYPANWTLLCYCHSRKGPVDFESAFKYFENHPPKLAQMWCLMRTDTSEGDHALVELYPGRTIRTFDLQRQYGKYKSQEASLIIKRGTGTEDSEAGEIYAPLP